MKENIVEATAFSSDGCSISEAQNRGFLNEDGSVEIACSLDYLIFLGLEVLRARAAPMVKLVRHVDSESRIRRLQFISTETRRLLQNPDLFPSNATRVRFAALIALDANLQFVEAVKHLLLQHIQSDLEQFNHNTYSRPHFVKGSKGWENFLCNMSPGVPLSDRLLRTTPKSSLQVIPPVGMRIVGDMCREINYYHDWNHRHPEPPKMEPAPTTRMIDIDNPESQAPNPDISLSQQSHNSYITPNPYQESDSLRIDVPIHGPEMVEDCTVLLARLEIDPPPAANMTGPNIFPIVFLRSFRPPTQFKDLKYHKPRSPNYMNIHE